MAESEADLEELKHQLSALLDEHRDLDEAINAMAELRNYDQVRIQRLKKGKLKLRDRITEIRNKLLPDIIA